MKALENFGGWILSTKSGAIFAMIVALLGAGITGYKMLTGPKSVTITASEFVCVDTEPHGISARCVAYRRVR